MTTLTQSFSGLARQIWLKKGEQLITPKKFWYLDSYISWYLTNNEILFIKNLDSKYLDFTTTSRYIFCAKSIETIVILLAGKFSIKLGEVAYLPKSDSNLVWLWVLRENKITYIGNLNTMTLI